jgi:GNAT superfamily N-acetyltransferase
MRCWTREELALHLAEAGFTSGEYSGGYDPTAPAGESDRLVVVTTRRSGFVEDQRLMFGAADDVYQSCGAAGRTQAGDRILFAEAASEVLGVVRLCPENGYLVLRGMRVRDDQQRRGVGRRLLLAAEEWIGNVECFCLPYTHLESFYRTIGFKPVPSKELPEHLQNRMADYVGRGLSVMGMKRSGFQRRRTRDYFLVGSTGVSEPLHAAETRLGRRTALTVPLLPPPQKN